MSVIPSGMQMMLSNLIKTAAPELAGQVDGMAVMVRSFDERLTRIEQLLIEIRDFQNGTVKADDNAGDGRNAGPV